MWQGTMEHGCSENTVQGLASMLLQSPPKRLRLPHPHVWSGIPGILYLTTVLKLWTANRAMVTDERYFCFDF